jgi:hypothetical protein
MNENAAFHILQGDIPILISFFQFGFQQRWQLALQLPLPMELTILPFLE